MRKVRPFVQSSCLLPELRSLKCEKNGLFFVFSANDSKRSITVWTKYLRAFERSYLPLLENAMNYWVLSYHWQDANP